MPFIPGPTPHIYRKFADHHVVKESRAEVHERTEFREHRDPARTTCVVKARRVGRDGEEIVYRAKYVIAADGPRSEVVAKLYPAFRDSIYWFVVGQKYYRADLDLDPQWFHFTINSQLGYYTWTPRRERLPHRRLHRRARRAVAEGAREGRRVLRDSTTACAFARRCSRKAASRTSACR